MGSEQAAVKQLDVVLPTTQLGPRPSLLVQKHIDYLATYGVEEESTRHDFEVTEHLRVSGVYWSLTALDLLGSLDRVDGDKVVAFVVQCMHDSGGFGGSVGHDPHLLYTLSAVQILTMYDATGRVDVERVVAYVAGLQREDGSFAGDKWGELDTRFSFCALACLSLLGRLDAVDVPAAVRYVVRCRNFDGAFGRVPGSESHAAQVFCCVGALAIAGALHYVDRDLLGWWLAERQLPSGGLNGRPEKLPDVCYSWWVLSALSVLDRLDWIDGDRLEAYILACQDEATGGIADRPGDYADPFHTLFGVAGISLLGKCDGLKRVHPIYCMCESTIARVVRDHARQ